MLTFDAELRGLISLSCFASNRVVDDRRATHLRRDTTINVSYRPRVERKARGPDLVRAVHGETLELHCRFEANPMRGSSVTWYRDGEAIPVDGGRFAAGDDDGSVLRVKSADKSLEGVYSCSARNEASWFEACTVSWRGEIFPQGRMLS